jgi:nicotinamide mononucleotide adenylyltransferase
MASNAPVLPAATQTFPHHRLRLSQNDPSRTPLVLVACGSFSPVTNLHLRMFEMAADFCKLYVSVADGLSITYDP